MTAGQLFQMSEARQLAEWDKVALICSTITNVNIARGPRTKPDDFHPMRYNAKGQTFEEAAGDA